LSPVYASQYTSRCITQNSGRVVRYSFLVGLFHSLLHAGLARRTEKAIFHQMTNASSSPNFRIADTPIQNMTVRRSQSIPID
ncbi:MAG TPA: hypothetical protein VFC29_11600, partial [Candidatus Limnocylindrales bacterium]|nr:hypothetical protein [Candidatus Limnocylindrales bacterium]